MSALQSPELDRLSDLFHQGDLDNADEIAALLTIELGEAPAVAMNENVQEHLALLYRLANQL